MAEETPAPVFAITLTSPRGATLPGTARWTVVPEWKRGLRAGAVLAVGVALAVPAVVFPPHGVVSGLLIAVTGVAAYALWTRASFVDEVAFTCTCGHEVTVRDIGQWTADTWVRCPSCASPWRVGGPEGA